MVDFLEFTMEANRGMDACRRTDTAYVYVSGCFLEPL